MATWLVARGNIHLTRIKRSSRYGHFAQDFICKRPACKYKWRDLIVTAHTPSTHTIHRYILLPTKSAYHVPLHKISAPESLCIWLSVTCLYPGRPAYLSTAPRTSLILSWHAKSRLRSFASNAALFMVSRYKKLSRATVNIVPFPFPDPSLLNPLFFLIQDYITFLLRCHYTCSIIIYV